MAIPKLMDIAAAAGVHPMTVSRALRNAGRMRPETRQRVLDAARRLGYRPNAAAAAMRTGHTGCIALLSSPLPGAFHLPPDALQAIVEAVAGRGGYLAHAALPAGTDVADALRLPRLLGRHLAEGVLLDGAHDAPPGLEEFLQRNALPAVWLNRKCRTNAVHPDDRGAARQVTEQLLALGHGRIACVHLAGFREPAAPRRVEHYSVAERIAGYEEAMQQAGLQPEVHVLAQHWDRWDEPREARLQPLADVFRDAARRPTALIACRDGAVLLALLLQLGLRVPEDVSLVSFADCPQEVAARLTSWVPVPFAEMGRKAVDTLYRLIEAGKRDTPAVRIPYGDIASLHTVRKQA